MPQTLQTLNNHNYNNHHNVHPRHASIKQMEMLSTSQNIQALPCSQLFPLEVTPAAQSSVTTNFSTVLFVLSTFLVVNAEWNWWCFSQIRIQALCKSMKSWKANIPKIVFVLSFLFQQISAWKKPFWMTTLTAQPHSEGVLLQCITDEGIPHKRAVPEHLSIDLKWGRIAQMVQHLTAKLAQYWHGSNALVQQGVVVFSLSKSQLPAQTVRYS